MMVVSSKEQVIQMKKVDKNFGSMLQNLESDQEWNRKIAVNIRNNSLMSLMNFLISQIKIMMRQGMIQKGQM